MDAKIKWNRKMAFTGTADSGHDVLMDAYSNVGGEDNGPRPTELVLMGLGGCTAMDVVSILGKMKQEVTDFEIKLHVDKADAHPKVFTHIVLEYILTGHQLDREAVDKAVMLSSEKYCSVQAMLRKTAEIEIKITINEAE
ncbi:MAG: OsmC family protein [Anaerolineaceae bacterium]|nr:OsmC family protein [Anaerolineaceae bacterium]